MGGRSSRSQPWVPPSIPCRDWAVCTIATAGARRRNRHFELDGHVFDAGSPMLCVSCCCRHHGADRDEHSHRLPAFSLV